MPRNLIGYFAGMPDCKQYTVKIIADRESDVFEEILLAGNSPFVVTYDTSNTPFEPLRQSRASISVVADEKFFDVFSSDPQGTRVVLEDASGNTEWTGFLNSNLISMPESSCQNETFTIEAEDCLRTLEQYKYHTDHKQIVTFKSILDQIVLRCQDIDTYVVDGSLLNTNGEYIHMSELQISEKNFFTSDTDEPWTLKEVLEEICKYLNLTAIQIGSKIILYDVQAHTNATVQDDNDVDVQLYCEQYYKDGDAFDSGHYGTTPDYMKVIPLRESILKSGQSDISLETIYNKIEVKDSFYEITDFIPDIWEDNYLTNRQGDFWKCSQFSYSGKMKFINKAGWEKEEEKDENEHVYYIRKFDHKDYESIYRNQNTLAVTAAPATNNIYLNNVQPSYLVDYDNPIDHQGELWYRGTYKVTATFVNTTSSQKTIHAYANLRYDWWDGEELMPDYDEGGDTVDLVLAKSGSTNSARTMTLTVTAEYPQKYSSSFSNGAWYRIGSASQTYPIIGGYDYQHDKFVTGEIVDLATFDRPMNNTNYLYETESNINFDRYLMIRQNNKPDRQHPYANWNFMNDLTPLTDQQTYTTFPPIFKLKEDYTNPFFYDNKAYLALDASAIFERYDREYINPDWTDENTNLKGLGLFKRLSSITTITPALVFSLKVGNKWWSSQSGWTTTQSAFVVKLGTDKTDEDDVDYTGWWNEDHPVLNNISWTDWAGTHGYKIPLEVGLDMNQPIEFAVHMPSKMQVFNLHDESIIRAGGSGSGINMMCWVKDLKIDFATKDSENYDNSDVVYRNIINSGAVNTLSDITMKITTYPGEGMHSYSNVGYNGVLIDNVVKTGLGSAPNKLEEQKIKAYANQYSSNTIKQNLSLVSSISPLDRIKDVTLDGKYFNIIGTKIDYADGSQTATLIETKPWSLD